jgi:glycosyltransferase involved in cell wall biosynthesis
MIKLSRMFGANGRSRMSRFSQSGQMNNGQLIDLSVTRTQIERDETASSEMSFALVHDWMAVSGGAEVTFHEICNLFEGPVYTSQCRFDAFPWLKGRKVVTSFVQKLPFALGRHYLYAPVMPQVFRRFDLTNADVVLADSHSFAHHVIPRPDALYVVYYHTTARSLWTPEIDDRAENGKLAWFRRRIAKVLRKLDLKASKRPDFIIANSQTTANRIKEHYHREADEIIYPPVDTQKWADVRRESGDEGLLIWGRLVSYKRIDLAIEAARITGEKLHIVGTGPMEAFLKRQAKNLPNVTFHGRLDDSELKRLMATCWGVIFPGYEDFGIVPVEAMAAGLPVVGFAKGGASETIAEGGGVLVDAQTPEAFAEGIRKMRGMKFDHLELRKRASQYDIGVFRERYMNAVQKAIASHRAK